MDDAIKGLLALPPDFFVLREAFTSKVHRDVYDAIDPTLSDLSLNGKVIVITGASQGIGKEGLVKQFVRAKPRAIVLAARNASKLSETAEFAKTVETEAEIMCVPTDITDETAVQALFQRVEQSYSTVDVLVNNAGVSVGHTTVDEMDITEWWQNFDVNVRGTLLMTKYFLGLLGSRNGTIVNISSAAAWNAPEPGAGYCMSKLAVVKLGQQMTARPNLVTVALHPGTVKTAMMPVFMEKFAQDPPELAGGTAVWLASEQARFMNGRYMSANWCVKELMNRQGEIVAGDLCKIGLSGLTAK